MTTLDAPIRSASALRLVLAAEHLFGAHGIDGVSLRQIAAEAGSGNNSAVHYHFGSKDRLIMAIFAHRLPQLIRERQVLLARATPHDLRSRLEAHYLPLLALAEDVGNRYLSFSEQLQRQQQASEFFSSFPAEWQSSQFDFQRDVTALLGHLVEPLRTLRIMDAQAMFLHAAADRERALVEGPPTVPFEFFVNSLLDSMTGYLESPPSEATLARLRQIDDWQIPDCRLL